MKPKTEMNVFLLFFEKVLFSTGEIWRPLYCKDVLLLIVSETITWLPCCDDEDLMTFHCCYGDDISLPYMLTFRIHQWGWSHLVTPRWCNDSRAAML